MKHADKELTRHSAELIRAIDDAVAEAREKLAELEARVQCAKSGGVARVVESRIGGQAWRFDIVRDDGHGEMEYLASSNGAFESLEELRETLRAIKDMDLPE